MTFNIPIMHPVSTWDQNYLIYFSLLVFKATDMLCFDKDIIVIKDLPPIEGFCKVAEGFEKYYTELITSEGLICVSSCDPRSPKYQDCNEGRCVIQKDIGPQCFCSSTNEYMYTGPHCTGKIWKSGVYGGISAAIVILIISIATVVYFLIKAYQNEKGDPFAMDEDDKWYQINEDESYVRPGFSNLQEFGEGSLCHPADGGKGS
ncbi:mucin-3A-like [Mixophyes fleayi]|uniref:mucin-3A-like n=1 Tax=Mixophyes fleayi TaxID=3061075 RepID=UPI003F4D91FC